MNEWKHVITHRCNFVCNESSESTGSLDLAFCWSRANNSVTVMISTYQRQTEHRLKCLSDKYIADEHSGNTATRAFYIFIDYLREERQLTKRDFDWFLSPPRSAWPHVALILQGHWRSAGQLVLLLSKANASQCRCYARISCISLKK